MRLKQFEYLSILAKEKSINSAARKLYLTPQSLSQDIKRLEKELGFDLLIRSNQGISLSKQGQEFLVLAQRFLNELDKIKASDDSLHEQYALGDNIQLIGSFGISSSLDQLISKIYLYSNTIVTLRELSFPKIVEELVKETAELAIVNFPFDNVDFEESGIESHVLSECRYVCIVSEDLAIAQYHSCSLKTLRQYPVIIYSKDGEWQSDKLFQTLGQPKRVIFAMEPVIYEKLTCTGAGISFALVEKNQKNLPSLPKGLKYIEIKDNFCTKRGYMKKKGKELSHHMQEFLRLLEDNFELINGSE